MTAARALALSFAVASPGAPAGQTAAAVLTIERESTLMYLAFRIEP